MHSISEIVALAVLALANVQASQGGEVDRQKIHDIQKAYWDSISSVEMTGEEFVLDSSLRRREGANISHQEIQIRYSVGARITFRSITRRPDGQSVAVRRFHEDGRAYYGFMTQEGDPEVIDDVVIQNQVSKPGHYARDMCLFLWTWMPGGKPIHVWLEEGATITSELSANQEQVIALRSDHHKRPVRMELDSAHDWLPTLVEIGGSVRYETKRFEKSRGHWFPNEVVRLDKEEDPAGNTATRRGFKISTLSINRPVAPATFGMPELPDGAHVRDERNWTGYFKGGIEARKRLEEAREQNVPASIKSAEDLKPAEVVAAVEPPRFPVEIVVLGISVFAFTASWKLSRHS